VDKLRGRNEAYSTLLTAGNKAASYWGRDANSADILGKRDRGTLASPGGSAPW
jgi:hypothetical protein